LVTSISELEVGSSRREFIDKLVDGVAQSCVLVSLKVCLEIVFGEAFVNLNGISVYSQKPEVIH
jgi:hypothetical protein